MSGDTSKPFLEHLEELRLRFLRVLALVLVFFGGCYFYVDPVISFLSKTAGMPFVFLHPTEAFFIKMKVAFIMAIFLSVPVILFEVWRFVSVALSKRERSWVLGVLPTSYFLFCTGVGLAWFVVLPAALKFLLEFSSPDLKPLLSLDSFVGFAAWLTLAFGGVFQWPILVFFLVRMEIVDPKTIAHYRPHIVVGLALLSAFLTPGPDVFSQWALFVPFKESNPWAEVNQKSINQRPKIFPLYFS